MTPFIFLLCFIYFFTLTDSVHASVLPCHVCAAALSMEGSQTPDHYAGRGPGGRQKSKFLKRYLCLSCTGPHFTEPTVQIFNLRTVFPSLYQQPDTFTFNTSVQIFCAERAEATFTLHAWGQVLRGFKACKYVPLVRVRVLFFLWTMKSKALRSGWVQRLTTTQMHWEEWAHTDAGVFVISGHQFTSLMFVHKLFHSRKRFRAKIKPIALKACRQQIQDTVNCGNSWRTAASHGMHNGHLDGQMSVRLL